MTKSIVLMLALASSVNAFAATQTYKCVTTENNAGDALLTVNSKKATYTNLDESYGEVGEKFTATIDKDYSPRPSSIEKIRYLGEQNGNDRQIIIDARLLDGVSKGYMQLRGSEDGYWSAVYSCAKI